MELGIDVRFEREVEDLSQLPDADLIVACDGVNSRLRRLHADSFGTDVVMGRNKYVWLGTTKVFDVFTFAFAETDAGWIWFYAYGFDGQASTVIVECSFQTWTGLGFDTLGAEGSAAVLARIFERQLDGHPLLNGVPDHVGARLAEFSDCDQREMASRQHGADGGFRSHHALQHRIGDDLGARGRHRTR